MMLRHRDAVFKSSCALSKCLLSRKWLSAICPKRQDHRPRIPRTSAAYNGESQDVCLLDSLPWPALGSPSILGHDIAEGKWSIGRWCFGIHSVHHISLGKTNDKSTKHHLSIWRAVRLKIDVLTSLLIPAITLWHKLLTRANPTSTLSPSYSPSPPICPAQTVSAAAPQPALPLEPTQPSTATKPTSPLPKTPPPPAQATATAPSSSTPTPSATSSPTTFSSPTLYLKPPASASSARTSSPAAACRPPSYPCSTHLVPRALVT